MWKFKDFSIPQILREINFGGSITSKTTVYNNLRGSEKHYFGKFQLTVNEKYKKITIRSLKICYSGRFCTS